MFEYFYFIFLVSKPMICHTMKMAKARYDDQKMMGIGVELIHHELFEIDQP
jgi:hypothetical protein